MGLFIFEPEPWDLGFGSWDLGFYYDGYNLIPIAA